MNTRLEMERLSLAVAALLDLPLSQVLNAQLDLAREYCEHLVASEWLTTEDAELLRTLPIFWTWWRQLWANRDNLILHNVPGELALKWHREGLDVRELYRAYHGPAVWGDLLPNDVLWAEFDAAKREQQQTYQHLKRLFTTS